MEECFVWLIVDTGLYLLLAWYFEHTFPGEYGVRQPFYFPLKPSFWFPKRAEGSQDVDNLEVEAGKADVEAVEGKEPGIVIQALSKHYTRDKIGVNKLTLTFYQNDITAFLGQNGAGKSTTMNTLVGLISPTSGGATVLSYDIHNQMHDIRQILGFVPQYVCLLGSYLVVYLMLGHW